MNLVSQQYRAWSDCTDLYWWQSLIIYGFCRIRVNRGIHIQVVLVIDFESLSSKCCEFKSSEGFWILSCEETVQLAYGTWLFSGASLCLKMNVAAPGVFLWKLETCTVWCKAETIHTLVVVYFLCVIKIKCYYHENVFY